MHFQRSISAILTFCQALRSIFFGSAPFLSSAIFLTPKFNSFTFDISNLFLFRNILKNNLKPLTLAPLLPTVLSGENKKLEV